MSITETMRNAYQMDWALTDDFQFTFHNTGREFKIGGGLQAQELLNVTVKSIDLPQLGSNIETVMQAGEYRIYSAKFAPFTFSITFRDIGGLELRNYFSAIWMDSQRGYFDDVKSTVSISMQATGGAGGTSPGKQRAKQVFKSDDCLITAVSQVQLDNDSTQIAEFTVEFSTPYYSNSQITDFGKDKWGEGTDFGLNSIETYVGGESGTLTKGLEAIRAAITISGGVKDWFK